MQFKLQRGTITFKETKDPAPIQRKQPFTKYLGMKAMYRTVKKKIPGTQFSEICPIQGSVFAGIIQDKVKKGATGVKVGVYFSAKNKRLTLMGDGHHSFCAAIEAGAFVTLYLYERKVEYNPMSSWQHCILQHGDPRKSRKKLSAQELT